MAHVLPVVYVARDRTSVIFVGCLCACHVSAAAELWCSVVEPCRKETSLQDPSEPHDEPKVDFS